jgi:hypothetical protein
MKLRYVILDRPGPHSHVAVWKGRCTYCGHRARRPDLPPDYPENQKPIIETRRQPWRIPSEIVHRYLAMRKGERCESSSGSTAWRSGSSSSRSSSS